MDIITEVPLTFSSQAVKEIKRLMDEPEFDKTKFLRIGVKGGGCSGLSYVLGFDNRLDTDQIFQTGDFQFVMNPLHDLYLNGLIIHWEDGLNARGFTFTNPNASKTCGCGTSFAV